MTDQISVRLLSDTTFSSGSGTAGEVDVEIVHDQSGLPYLRARTLRGLLRESWLTMAWCFPDLDGAAPAVFGPARDLAPGGTSLLRLGDARLGDDIRQWAAYATERKEHPLARHDVLISLTDIRRQTGRDRTTGAPRKETLRASRVARRSLEFLAPVDVEPGFGEEHWEVLARACLGTRHAGAGRNRGRGHIRLSLLRAGVDLTEELARQLAVLGSRQGGVI